MRGVAERVERYVSDRVGDSLLAVGYHTEAEFGMLYLRDDVGRQTHPQTIESLVAASRGVSRAVNSLQEIGPPRATLHALADGLVIQFHRAPDGVVFVSVDDDVGRDFTRFVDDCVEQVDWTPRQGE